MIVRTQNVRSSNAQYLQVNARIGQYVGYNAWQLKTQEGATIQDACDYAMTFTASQSNETAYDSELYPNVAAVAAIYGDADGKYSKWLASRDTNFPSQPYFLWDQPLSNAGRTGAATQGGNSSTPNTSSGNTGSNNAAKQVVWGKETVWFGSLLTISVLLA
jgi:hypothetical protein